MNTIEPSTATPLTAASPVRAVLRVSRHKGREYLVALCPIGHLIDHTEITARGFAGSRTESDWSAHQHGAETRWDRLAAKCDGAGHGEPQFYREPRA